MQLCINCAVYVCTGIRKLPPPIHVPGSLLMIISLGLQVFSLHTLVGITDILVSLCPGGMETSLHIGTFVGVTTKEITLSLSQVRWQPSSPIRIKVGQGAGQTGAGNTRSDTQRNNATPSSGTLIKLLRKELVHQQVGQGRGQDT